jgi:nicotinic acid phosphoribosyltransferase
VAYRFSPSHYITQEVTQMRIHSNVVDSRRVEQARKQLDKYIWSSPDEATDVYFVRSAQIIEAYGLGDLWTQRCLFARNKASHPNGTMCGVEEIIAVLANYSQFFENGGRVWAVPPGTQYNGIGTPDTLVVIEGLIKDTIKLETIYLGQWASKLTEYNLGFVDYDLDIATRKFQALTRELSASEFPDRDLIYFGARHHKIALDSRIALAAHKGGATGSATKGTEYIFSRKPVGTIPHALENVFAYHVARQQGYTPGAILPSSHQGTPAELAQLAALEMGFNQAVQASVRAFAEVMGNKIAAVCLCDYRNAEVTDTLASIKVLAEIDRKLMAARIDTNGALVAEGAYHSLEAVPASLRALFPIAGDPAEKYWYGRGVTVSGVVALKQAIENESTCPEAGVFLTSGMGDALKLRAFIDAERNLLNAGAIKTPLFSGLGVGGVFPGEQTIITTDDITAVGTTGSNMIGLHKTGRPARMNPLLVPAAGECPSVHPRMASLFQPLGY